jgi:transcriptional regulator with XRE-family HTH domain
VSRPIHPVKVVLAELGITQRQLAEATDYAPQTLSQVLNGRLAPWPALKCRVATYLGRPESELFPDAVERLIAQAEQQGYGRAVTDLGTLKRVAGLVGTTMGPKDVA